MIDTGDVPVEKTTWSFFVPENYALSYFKTNMEAIDVSVIEVEKTLDLAKEYKYWTGVARTSKGELREKAIFNRSKVMSDFGDQYSLGQTMQYSLSSKQGDKKYNQALISKAQSKNVQILNEAQQIMDSNRAEVPVAEQAGAAAPQKAAYDSARRNVKGWQFKTDNFNGQEQVEQQISQYLQQEDSKQMAIKNKGERAVRRKVDLKSPSLDRGQVRDEEKKEALLEQEQQAAWTSQSEGWDSSAGVPGQQSVMMGEVGPGSAVRERAQGGYQASQYAMTDSLEPSAVINAQQEFWGADTGKEHKPSPAVTSPPAAPAEKKKSALLKGQRSIDIPFPEEGQRFSFKKLGGNPTMTFVYRKSEGVSKIVYLLLCAVALTGVLKVRRARFPLEKLDAFAGRIRSLRLQDVFCLIVDSRWCKIITFTVMVPAFMFGAPCYVITVGFASVFLIRVISRRRHKKMGRQEVYNIKVFLKYFPSYIIVLASFLSVGHMAFLVFVGIATALNFFLAGGYGLLTLLTRKVVEE
jgi:hypothetical protein